MWNSTNVSSSGQPSSPLPYSKYEPFSKESHSKWILSVFVKIYFNDFYANFKNKGYALTVFSLFWVVFLLLIANGVGEAVAGAAKIVLRKPKPYMDSSGPSSRLRRNFMFFVVF